MKKKRISIKALYISLADANLFVGRQKIFINAKEALSFYKEAKAVSKYRVISWKVWAHPVPYHQGLTWSGR